MTFWVNIVSTDMSSSLRMSRTVSNCNEALITGNCMGISSFFLTCSFAYDLVPDTTVVEQALRACRRVNDFSTAVRIFEGLKEKTENKAQYEAYLKELEPLRRELGVPLYEELG